MGWDPDAQQLQALNSEQAAQWTKGPVFHEGEEIELKGVPFIIVDIAPGQIKLKPKRVDLEAALAKAEKAVLDARKMCPPGSEPLA